MATRLGGRYRGTGGTTARRDGNNSFAAPGAATVPSGIVSHHSLGDPDAPGAHDFTANGMTLAQVRAALKGDAKVKDVIYEPEAGGQGRLPLSRRIWRTIHGPSQARPPRRSRNQSRNQSKLRRPQNFAGGRSAMRDQIVSETRYLRSCQALEHAALRTLKGGRPAHLKANSKRPWTNLTLTSALLRKPPPSNFPLAVDFTSRIRRAKRAPSTGR